MRNERLRNIGIIAHVDAGKTTLTERILYLTGMTHTLGDVHNGNTVTDSDRQEKEHGITIGSAAVTVSWKQHQINVIDTPGHIDFNIEVNRSLRVLDGAVVVLDAVAGVEPQTETNWRLADRYNVPRICLINKMDRIGANFFDAVNEIESQLNAKPLVVQLPIGCEDSFEGVINIISMRAFVWNNQTNMNFEEISIPNHLLKQADDYREKLLDTLSLENDHLVEALINNEGISREKICDAIRTGTIDGIYTPVLCASAYKNKGVQPILDAVIDYLPSPDDVSSKRKGITESEKDSDNEDLNAFVALAFKVSSDDHGSLTYLRVYEGYLEKGDKVLNTANGKFERISKIYLMHANKRESLNSMKAGDIVAVQGLKHTLTGNTLCNPQHPVELESIAIPVPVIDLAIEPSTKQDQSRLSEIIQTIVKEDPSLKASTNSSGQLILAGMGELHLEIVIDRLRQDYHLNLNVGQPNVAYKETISQQVTVDYLHKKQDGGPGQYAGVTIELTPIKGEDIEFENKVIGGSVPNDFIPSVEQGIREAAKSGILNGYPCGGFKATLLDGRHHAQDSSQVAFKIAAIEAFKKAATAAKPILLEPVMALEIVAPQDCVGDCIGDLSRRRGEIKEQEHLNNGVLLKAYAPLIELFGYIADLRSLTAGRATYTMMFDHYGVVPNNTHQSIK